MDSLGAMELHSRLAGEFATAKLSRTVVFDHPTIDAMAALIFSQLDEIQPERHANGTAAWTTLSVQAALEEIRGIVVHMLGFQVIRAGKQHA